MPFIAVFATNIVLFFVWHAAVSALLPEQQVGLQHFWWSIVLTCLTLIVYRSNGRPAAIAVAIFACPFLLLPELRRLPDGVLDAWIADVMRGYVVATITLFWLISILSVRMFRVLAR